MIKARAPLDALISVFVYASGVLHLPSGSLICDSMAPKRAIGAHLT